MPEVKKLTHSGIAFVRFNYGFLYRYTSLYYFTVVFLKNLVYKRFFHDHTAFDRFRRAVEKHALVEDIES